VSTDEIAVPTAETSASEQDAKVPLFGARGRARDLQRELNELKTRQQELGVGEAIELQRLRDALREEIAAQREQLASERATEQAALAADLKAQHTEGQSQINNTRAENNALAQRLDELRSEVVVTEELVLLQEAGIYEYRHPLDDAVAYQERLATLREQIKAMTRKDGGAVLGATNWTVNGSAPQGRAMVRDFSKLMLRAYNAEADNLVRALKPYKLDTAIERLTKVATTIVKLGKTMDIRISDAYHRLRIQELELTADFRARQAEEKEHEREEQARVREERKAQQELQRERERLEKERQHYENALAALQENANDDGAQRMRDQLADIDRAIQDVDYRAANIRAGYVYVISNVGSFGERIVKIGMTRRLEPLDRVRELGDASVPFRYDVHALFFSDDAVGIEAQLHQRLADRRVNQVNLRREFFYATPAEVKLHLRELAGELLQYEEVPEALEFRQGKHG
jgi:chromosome segregation ATPase